MRDYTELIKQLRECGTRRDCLECPYDSDKSYCIEPRIIQAADAIEELLDELTTIRKQLPHWISVEERLPRPFVSVLVNIPGEKPFPTVKEAFLEKTGMWYSIGFRYEPEEVTHWCEMPEPPKGVE